MAGLIGEDYTWASALGGGVEGFAKGMMQAEDMIDRREERKFKRMEWEAKQKSDEADREKKRLEYEADRKYKDLQLRAEMRGKGFLVPPVGQDFDPSTAQMDPQWVQAQTGLRSAGATADPYGTKGLTAEIARMNLQKGAAEAAERERAKTPQGKIEKLPGDARKRFDDVTGSLDALRDVKEAYAALPRTDGKTVDLGARTEMVDVPLRGDTAYTSASRQFGEFLGRLQSGGVISKDEMVTFKGLLPSPFDAPDVAEKKLADLEFRLGARLKTFGVSSEDVEGAGFLKKRGLLKRGLVPQEGAAPPAPRKTLKTDEIQWAD